MADRVMLQITHESLEMMSTIALVYVVHHWDEFKDEMGLEKGPEGANDISEMRDEICHYTAEMLYRNDSVLTLLMVMWGEEKTMEFVKGLTNHNHGKQE